jgi:iron complex outermembrane receptor protein
LIFTPIHAANVVQGVQVGKWSIQAFAQYSGRRFTEGSNDPLYSLAPFVLADLSVGRIFLAGRHGFDIQVSVRNIFNTDYQLYAGRAMPGRYFNLQLNYQFKQKQL